MIKNNVFMKHFRLIFAVILASVAMITLSGCAESSDKVPTGGLNSSDVYATNGTYSVTVGDLYEELRHNSLGFLNQRIEEITFNDYLSKVDKTNEDHKQLIAEYIFVDIHGTYDEDEISDLSTYTKDYNIYKFVDTMLMEGYYVTYSQLTVYTIENMLNSEAYTTLWDEYAIEVAKYLYAYDVLTEEIAEHNEDAESDDELDTYFTDSQIASYFDTNYSYEGDVNAVLIRFISSDEADAVFKKFGIKSYNGDWYLIQPPKDDYGQIDYSKWSSESTYNKYYDEYTITQSGTTSSDAPIASLGTDTTILKMFIEIYNYIYTYRTTITYDGRTTTKNSLSNPISSGISWSESHYLYYYTWMMEILDDDRNGTNTQTYEDLVSSLTTTYSTNLNFTKEKLDTYSTSLTTYLHDSLRTSPEIDDDGNEEDFIQYTASSRSYNNNNYLIFKLSDADKPEFYEIDEDEDGEEIYVFNKDLQASEVNVDSDLSLYDQIMEDLFNDELSSAYISNKASERGDFITVSIYDSMLELSYSLANDDYTGTKGTKTDLIASIKFEDKDNKLEWTIDIKVTEAYAFLEPIYGAQTSTYLLFDQLIEDSTYYSDVTEEEDYYETYKESVYTTLTLFANDSYSSYGYPASIGKYNFMKSFYRTANVDEAIEYLTLQEAKRQYFLDLDDDFYSKMASFTQASFDNYYSLTLNNITVYVDMDEDGIPDTDWFNTNSDGYFVGNTNEYIMSAAEKNQLANNLINDIITYAKKSTDDLATSLTNVVTEYNNTTRIVPNSSDYELSGTAESKWAKYRKHGLYISTSSLGEFGSMSTGLDKDIQDIVQSLYANSEVIFNNSFSGAYLYEDEFVVNDDGYNLLLVTAGSGKVEIDLDNEDSDLYMNVPIKINDSYKIYDDLSSNGINATEVQVEVYCREYFANGSSTSLSGTATTYLDTYLTPVLTKYNSEVVQLMIITNALGEITSSENANFNDNLTTYIAYLQRVSDDYIGTAETYLTTYYSDFWAYIATIGGAN